MTGGRLKPIWARLQGEVVFKRMFKVMANDLTKRGEGGTMGLPGRSATAAEANRQILGSPPPRSLLLVPVGPSSSGVAQLAKSKKKADQEMSAAMALKLSTNKSMPQTAKVQPIVKVKVPPVLQDVAKKSLAQPPKQTHQTKTTKLPLVTGATNSNGATTAPENDYERSSFNAFTPRIANRRYEEQTNNKAPSNRTVAKAAIVHGVSINNFSIATHKFVTGDKQKDSKGEPVYSEKNFKAMVSAFDESGYEKIANDEQKAKAATDSSVKAKFQSQANDRRKQQERSDKATQNFYKNVHDPVAKKKFLDQLNNHHANTDLLGPHPGNNANVQQYHHPRMQPAEKLNQSRFSPTTKKVYRKVHRDMLLPTAMSPNGTSVINPLGGSVPIGNLTPESNGMAKNAKQHPIMGFDPTSTIDLNAVPTVAKKTDPNQTASKKKKTPKKKVPNNLTT